MPNVSHQQYDVCFSKVVYILCVIIIMYNYPEWKWVGIFNRRERLSCPQNLTLELINSDYHHWSVLHNSRSHFQITHRTGKGKCQCRWYIYIDIEQDLCVALGHFLIAWIRRVYYTPPCITCPTYVRMREHTNRLRVTIPGPAGIPDEFHRRNSRG